MRRIPIRLPKENYIETLEAIAMLPEGTTLDGLQKYSIRGSRRTWYLISDVEGITEEAIHAEDAEPDEPEQKKAENVTEEYSVTDPLNLVAFVDGSYNAGTGVYGSAAVILCGGDILAVKKMHGKRMAKMRNVGGEICAAGAAVQFAEQLVADSLIIRYDYEGIEKWATGAWQAKNEYTQGYRDFINKDHGFPIRFEHVKAHTGNHYNEMADTLAKQAAGIIKRSSI